MHQVPRLAFDSFPMSCVSWPLPSQFSVIWSQKRTFTKPFVNIRDWFRACSTREEAYRCFSEALVFDFLGDALLQTFHVRLFLLFEVTRHSLKFRVSVCIGNVLIVAPQRIESFVQVLDEIVV